MSSATFGFAYSPLTGHIMAWDGMKFAPTSTIKAALTIAADFTFADGINVVLDSTTGTKIGTATGQKLGFWNATPIIQPASANQAAAPTDAAALLSYGYTEAQANGIVTLINAIRSALVDAGIMKGAA